MLSIKLRLLRLESIILKGFVAIVHYGTVA